MENEKPVVLYIDDEQANLTTFKANFRRDFVVHCALSAAEGREILDKEPVHIIVADQRMPQTTGTEFFGSILETYPKPKRILLTGYADISSVIEAINLGHVYLYLTKPFDDTQLKNAIQKAYDMYMADEEIDKKNRELIEAYEDLDRFVYSASHDLTAPLMSVRGLIRLAKMDEYNPEYLELIDKSINKLYDFIKNIIAYHRNTKSLTKFKEINFEKLIHETIDSFEFYENKTEIDFELSVVQKEPFKCDEPRLKIILNNLVSNAIKYKDKKKENPLVNISVEVADNKAVLTVADNGIGIKKEYQDEIFEMFFRATHENAGSGIGLYVVKEAVRKLGGDIDVKSTEGVGTLFTLTIPGMQ